MKHQEKKPPFWNGTHRAFKETKRKEFRAVLAAFDTFRRGSAFVPGYLENIYDLKVVLERWNQAISVKNWGR